MRLEIPPEELRFAYTEALDVDGGYALRFSLSYTPVVDDAVDSVTFLYRDRADAVALQRVLTEGLEQLIDPLIADRIKADDAVTEPVAGQWVISPLLTGRWVFRKSLHPNEWLLFGGTANPVHFAVSVGDVDLFKFRKADKPADQAGWTATLSGNLTVEHGAE